MTEGDNGDNKHEAADDKHEGDNGDNKMMQLMASTRETTTNE